MNQKQSIRDTVIRSLSAIGAIKDARFYAELFSSQEPEQFALIVIDPRCLKNPLLESLIGNIRILADLGLTPTLLVGALDDDMTSIRFQSQRLAKDLESAKVKTVRLNTESYGLLDSVRKAARQGRVSILENTRPQKRKDLMDLVGNLSPGKVIFLQPSGGISQHGKRVPVINIDDKSQLELDGLSHGQARFIDLARKMLDAYEHKSVFIIASPLNLLQELFTVKGSGTLIRRGARVNAHNSFKPIDEKALQRSIELGFEKSIASNMSEWPVRSVLLEENFRGGAILTEVAGMTYLSKFWVVKEAQGEGIARDIWDGITKRNKSFFWRSRRENPFNDWYIKVCDGMQVSGDWRVFWRGLSLEQIQTAIDSAIRVPDDF